MSKIDPAEIKGLDRRSTVLLQATDKRTEDEKGLDVEDPGIDGLRGLGGVLGSMHRVNTARRSMVSKAELEERSEFRRRRRDTLIERARSSHGDVEMGSSGMRRHQLYDAPMPMPEDAADRISASQLRQDHELCPRTDIDDLLRTGMHSSQHPPPRSGTMGSLKDDPLPAIPLSPRARAGTIRFDEAQVQGHEHLSELPNRSDSFPKVQPFVPPEGDDSLAYDRPSIRLAAPNRSFTGADHLSTYGGYRDPYGGAQHDDDVRGPKSAPPLGPADHVPSRLAGPRQRTESTLTAGSARSWGSKGRIPASPRTMSFHLRGKKDEEEERERESLVGSPNVDAGEEFDARNGHSGGNSDDEEVMGVGRDSGVSSGSESYGGNPVTPLDGDHRPR